MHSYLRRTWAAVDLDCVAQNYREIRGRLSPDCKLMAVVKADAYGHGDAYVAGTLMEAGADWFGVSNLTEALSLRKQGIDRPVLILGFTPPEEAGTLARMGFSQSVFSFEYARALSEAAEARGVTVDCHIKIDTGMSRIGFYAQRGQEAKAAEEAAAACGLPGLSCTGIFTHFSCADEPDADSDAYTRGQFDAFMKTVKLLRKGGRTFLLRHCCNSAGTLRFPEMHLDMVRAGVVLYGLAPSPECRGLCALHPAMSLYTTVTQVKQVEAGVSVSYGRRYQAPEGGRRIASIAVGYADGFRRTLSNRGRVLVHGRYAPIVGAVCMDQLMIDVSGVPGVQMGDRVTLVGGDGENALTLDELAALNGTINYEEACLIGRRVPRVYMRGGREAGVVDYII